MMHILIEIFILFTMLCSPELTAEEIICYLPNQISTSLRASRINQKLYVKLTDIVSQLLTGSSYNPAKNTVSFKKGNLYIVSQSSALLYQLSDGSQFKATMRYPAIRQQSEIIVPFEEFTTAINSFGLRSIFKNNELSYRIGKGIDPAIAATFAIPAESVTDESDNENLLEPPVDQEQSLIIDQGDEQRSLNEQTSVSIEPIGSESINSLSLQAIAESASIANKEVCTISRITLDIDNQDVYITFAANIPIEQYQKPEIRGRELIVRFPNAENGISTFSELIKHEHVQAFSKEKIRNYLLYIVRFSKDIEDVSIKKTSPKTVKVSVRLKKQEIIQTPKQSIGAWDLDVIVLDPGHGGEDAGAISINGYKEKDIALSISKKVKELLKKELPSTKVVMTRDDDTFVELYRRGQIANKQKGKLFISIHCNSMPSKPHPANGCESYILRPGRNSEAVRVAEKENSSIRLEKEQINYDDMSEEKLIISTMAQSAFVKFSEKFSAMLQKEVSNKTGLFNRGVNQAGFLVLVGASMPNVLFETGFLSNVNDEKILITEKGQQSMAEGIARAVKRYANEYAKHN
ncbi:MAG: N-acetylmuramoyl-L-alanine amidase [Ignavibacteria bacterium]|jgi:N-acetylmuramoyl-L-alanine amidase